MVTRMNKTNSHTDVSKKAFSKAFKCTVKNLTSIELEYSKATGHAAYEKPGSFRRWFTTRYGSVDLRKI